MKFLIRALVGLVVLAVLLAGTIPFMSFVADYQLHKYVRIRGLGPSEQPSVSP